MKARALLLAIPLVTACGGGAADTHSSTSASGGHPIHLARQLPVGYAWGELAQFASTQRQTISAGGAVVQDTTTNSAIELAGDYSVLALGADGQPSRLRLAVDHVLVDSGSGAVAAMLPPVIVIERGDPGTIAGENGEAIAADTIELLRRVVPERSRPVDDDAVFGTREPQQVGASWPLDSQGAARGLAALHLTVDPSNVGGSTTLVTAGTEGGIDVLGLRTEIIATHIGFPGLPPGSVERRADVRAATEMVLPVDPGIVSLREADESAIDIEVTVPADGGGTATVDVVIHEQVLHTRTPRAS